RLLPLDLHEAGRGIDGDDAGAHVATEGEAARGLAVLSARRLLTEVERAVDLRQRGGTDLRRFDRHPVLPRLNVRSGLDLGRRGERDLVELDGDDLADGEGASVGGPRDDASFGDDVLVLVLRASDRGAQQDG